MASHVRPVPTPSSDESLLTHGSTSSSEDFFDAERARLFGALSVMTGNRHEAEEIMQDAFLRLWERWELVSAMDEPVGFLYRTAMNLYRKHLRRAAVAMRKFTNLLPPDDALASVEARDQATRLLRTLTPGEREALVFTAYSWRRRLVRRPPPHREPGRGADPGQVCPCGDGDRFALIYEVEAGPFD